MKIRQKFDRISSLKEEFDKLSSELSKDIGDRFRAEVYPNGLLLTNEGVLKTGSDSVQLYLSRDDMQALYEYLGDLLG